MNILHLSAVNTWGGGENHIENLCKELSTYPENIKNHIICVNGSDFHKKLQNENIPFKALPLTLKFDLRYVFGIISLVKKKNIDLIHIHDTSAILLAILADKFYNLPPFVFSKKTSFPIKQRKRTLYKYNYQKIKKILCVSEQTKKITAQAIENKNKLVTIYHGTNLNDKSNETPFKLREEHHIPEKKIIVGCIANHIRAKHLDTFIDVIDEIVNGKEIKDFHFVQIGSYSERTESLIRRIKELNLEDYVSFLGYQPKASNFLPQFDLLLLTSQSEGLPQVIYEALYHKIPIVSTDVGGIPEVIEHNKNGLLAPMHKPKILAEHIINLSRNKVLQEKFKTLGHQILISKFTVKNMAKETFQIYRDIIN